MLRSGLFNWIGLACSNEEYLSITVYKNWQDTDEEDNHDNHEDMFEPAERAP